MKIKFLFLILVLSATYSYGQIKFEKGYLIDNENHRIECLIKNYDWKNTPDELEYKLGDSDSIQKGTVLNVKEFGVSGISKFIMVDTRIDRSSEELNTLSSERKPIWSEEQLFLKVLIEGKASLYQYRLRNFVRYFYSVSGAPVKQLIYKQFYVSKKDYPQDKSVAYNNDFRQQLWNDLRNTETTMSSVEKINYEQSELERYFKQYNGVDQKTIKTSGRNRDFLLFRITPGINSSSVSVMQNIFGPVFTNKFKVISFRIGMEVDYILPFNKNKWQIIFDPSYQYFNSSSENGSNKVDINYKWIEFPIGIRYNFYLNDNFKIFLNGFFVPLYTFDFKSTVDVTFANSKYYQNFDHNNSFAFGAGLHYKKLSLECRYIPTSDIYSYYIWTDYQRFSFILGYTLFKINHK